MALNLKPLGHSNPLANASRCGAYSRNRDVHNSRQNNALSSGTMRRLWKTLNTWTHIVRCPHWCPADEDGWPPFGGKGKRIAFNHSARNSNRLPLHTWDHFLIEGSVRTRVWFDKERVLPLDCQNIFSE